MSVNSEELYARIKDAPWANYKTHVTVGGAGGLGSWVAFFLARIGHGISSYDFDVVGDENIGGGQLYSLDQIGREKTSALKENLWKFSGHNDFVGLGNFQKGSPVTPLTIATFDNMESRMDMLQSWEELVAHRTPEQKKKYIWAFMNVSMLPEGGFIELIDRPSRIEQWKKDWQPSADMPDLICSFKATTHNAANVATHVISIINNMIVEKFSDTPSIPLEYRTVIDNKLLTLDQYN